MVRTSLTSLFSIGVLLVLAACGVSPTPTGSITIQEAWARPVTVSGDIDATEVAEEHAGDAHATATGDGEPSGVTGGAYLTIINAGAATDQLVRITADVAEAVEVHTTVMENNVTRMQPVPAIDIPANGQVEFKPGSYHIMLINVRRTFMLGDTIPLTLTFKNAGDRQVAAEVRQP